MNSAALRLEVAVNTYALLKDALKNVFSAAQDALMIYAVIAALVKAYAVVAFQLRKKRGKQNVVVVLLSQLRKSLEEYYQY